VDATWFPDKTPLRVWLVEPARKRGDFLNGDSGQSHPGTPGAASSLVRGRVETVWTTRRPGLGGRPKALGSNANSCCVAVTLATGGPGKPTVGWGRRPTLAIEVAAQGAALGARGGRLDRRGSLVEVRRVCQRGLFNLRG